MSEFVKQGDVLVEAEAWPLLQRAGLASFDSFMGFPGGQRVVHKRGRSVFRIEVQDRTFFLKRNRLHRIELLKQLSRGKVPPRSALQEWGAIQAVADAGIPTVRPVAFGERTLLGMETASFTLTEELYGARPLDEIVSEKFTARDGYQEKRALIKKAADLARQLHGAGMNHQDLYLNHFFFNEKEDVLSLLDLQRVQIRERVPARYLIKDLAQLTFSSQRFPTISLRDKLRFLLIYRDEAKLSQESRQLLIKIIRKVSRIARHDVKLTSRRRARGEMS